jgi:uncharacterized protein (DUF1778 family)
MSNSLLLESDSRSTRFDARLSKKQKMIFSEAASIMGFKTLSEFVIQTTQTAALQIIERNKNIINSDNDREVFFNALTNPPKANKTLKEGFRRYKNTFNI